MLVLENLFSQKNYSHHTNANYSLNCTSAVVKVDDNSTYSLHFKVTDTNRFGIYQGDLFNGLKSHLYNKVDILGRFKGTDIGDIIETTFNTEVGQYIAIYLSNEKGNAREPSLMVNRGSKLSDIFISARADVSNQAYYPPDGEYKEIQSI